MMRTRRLGSARAGDAMRGRERRGADKTKKKKKKRTRVLERCGRGDVHRLGHVISRRGVDTGGRGGVPEWEGE